MRRVVAIAVGSLLLVSLLGEGAGARSSRAAVQQNPGLFLNILPAGQGTSTTAADAARFETTGERPKHDVDQRAMYARLPIADAITDSNLSRFFKAESFGPAGPVERVERPISGLTITRDRFGVPHIVGATRAKAEFGAGYVAAEDRLFMIDVLRHLGRGRLSEFLGPSRSNLAMDRGMYQVAGYSKAELRAQIARADRFGTLGQQALADVRNYVAGINARIEEDRTHPNEMPAEYPALQLVPTDWSPGDVVAIATLIQAIFAAGGGNELGNAHFLSKAKARLGPKRARSLWRDLRQGNDPEAPVTTTRRFPYENAGKANPRAVAMPDRGSVRMFNPITTQPPESGASSSAPAPESLDPLAELRARLAAMGIDFTGAMSNWLAVTRQFSAAHHPVAVMGPQTGYFSPEILMEEDIQGPGIHARGAAFPGISLYVLLGRGRDYAWSATSGESDLVDIRAERLCNPNGRVTRRSTHYRFRGRCRSMYVRNDHWFAKPTAAGEGTPTKVTAHVRRTVHGPVIATGTVHGHPVAFTIQRSTFFHEPDSALAFELMDGDRVTGPRSFMHVISKVAGSFNWLYVDERNVAYYHSGKYPVRAPGVNPYLPSWGTGRWEWRGFVPFVAHPHDVNPARGWIASWNNKPARAWHAADAQWGYGPVHRVQMLSRQLARRVPRGGMTPAAMVRIMARAATVDLRGQEDLPLLLRALGQGTRLSSARSILRAWKASGGHRVDRDRDGQYDQQAAVALMDRWWPRLMHAMFHPELSRLYRSVLLPFDDRNRRAHLGSSFQSGYYGYVSRTIRMAFGLPVRGRYRVLRCADGTRAGCRRAVRQSLAAAVKALGPDPSKWDANEGADRIQFQPVGVITVAGIPWQNRPTFQQVVQVTAHRPR
jgi:acyl-homoserine lactone acylase PvdQ